MFHKKMHRWYVPKGQELTEMDKKILYYQNKGSLVPTRKLIKTPEQIEGIRRSGVVNTGVLDLVEREIHAGMSTAEVDKLVYDYTLDHHAVPATLGYEGFPKSCCVSINEVVCHGIPNKEEILEEGDIVNVDCTTILDGYYADASRMFIIGKTTPEKEKLVRVAKECLEIGMQVAKPYCFVGDIGNAIDKTTHTYLGSTMNSVMNTFTGGNPFAASIGMTGAALATSSMFMPAVPVFGPFGFYSAWSSPMMFTSPMMMGMPAFGGFCCRC